MAQSPPKIPPRAKGGAGRPNKPLPPKRRSGRSPIRWWLLAALIIAIVVVLIVVLVTSGGGSSKKANDPAVNWKIPGTNIPAYGPVGPEQVPLEVGTKWPGDPNTPLRHTNVIDGIQCGGAETFAAYHWHAHLAIFVNGKPYALPLAIGMVPPAYVQSTPKGQFASASALCWLHVHATDGIIHMESAVAKTFRLGNFFDIWGQTFSASQLGPFHGTVTATVDGVPYTGDPGQILLTHYKQIVINVGTPIITPPAIRWSGTSL